MSDPVVLSMQSHFPEETGSFDVSSFAGETCLEEGRPAARDSYVLKAGPWEDMAAALPFVAGVFSILPYLEGLKGLKAKAAERAVDLEVRVIEFLGRKLAEIPSKPSFDEDGTLRQFNPLVKVKVEKAWNSLTARQRVEFAQAESPDGNFSLKRPPETPPPGWTTSVARALFAEAEMPQDGGGLEEARGRVRLAAEFAKLGLFQEAADSALEAAMIFEKKEKVKGTSAHVFEKVSLYAESAGNVSQAADAMREVERVRIAIEIEKALEQDGRLGSMKVELTELKARLAEIIAREAVEEPALLARIVEYSAGSSDGVKFPALKEGWREEIGSMLKDGMSSILERESASILASRGGFASDRLSIDRLVRFAKSDEQMRKTLGDLSDPELRSRCRELYLQWKALSSGERDAAESIYRFSKGYVEKVVTMAKQWVQEETARLEAMKEKGKALPDRKEAGRKESTGAMGKAVRVIKGIRGK